MAENEKYANPSMGGIVSGAMSGRAKQIDDAESAALNGSPRELPAAPKPTLSPAQPVSPGIVDRVKSMFGGKSNPDNQLPDSSMHKPGSRGAL